MVIKIQSLTRGFINRNMFYDKMKQINYKPINEDLRKQFIGYKLGLISKKQRFEMAEKRIEAGHVVDQVSKHIKNTESLLESFYPNVTRIMNAKQKRDDEQNRKKKEEDQLNNFWQIIRQQALERNENSCPICYN